MTQDFTFPYEPKPRDFSARLARRRMRGITARRRHPPAGRRAALLLAAVAVPALAAPGVMPAFLIGDASRSPVSVTPMPFETAGNSFPGSAFYYLAANDEAAAPAAGFAAGIHSDADPAITLLDPLAGPAARAMRIDSSGADRSRAEYCLTAAIYYEAATEPDAGQRAVAQVVLNRVAHRSYPGTVCGVVYQGSERSTGCQFSFTCDGSLARAPSRLFWERAAQVARMALAGHVYAPIGLATHYHTIAVNPYWAPSLAYLGTIGAHRFYKFAGAAGQPSAFRFAYYGGEPIAAPHPHSAAADTLPATELDPMALQRAYDGGLAIPQSVTPVAAASPPPNYVPTRAAPPVTYAAAVEQRGGEALYRGDRLPQATGIRPEYANSGRWIIRPGS